MQGSGEQRSARGQKAQGNVYADMAIEDGVHRGPRRRLTPRTPSKVPETGNDPRQKINRVPTKIGRGPRETLF